MSISIWINKLIVISCIEKFILIYTGTVTKAIYYQYDLPLLRLALIAWLKM